MCLTNFNQGEGMSYKILEAGIVDKVEGMESLVAGIDLRARRIMIQGSGNHLVDAMDKFLSQPCDCGECEDCIARADAQKSAEDMEELEEAEARHSHE